MSKSPLDAQVEELALTTRAYRCIVRGKIKSIAQLASLTDEQLLRLPNFGTKSLAEVKRALASWMENQPRGPGLGLGTEPARKQSNVGVVLADLRIAERDWVVLEFRNGLSTRHTLEEVGQELGRTRERARQIQARAEQRIGVAYRQGRFDGVFAILEIALQHAPSGIVEPSALLTRIRVGLKGQLPEMSSAISKQVVALIRTLVSMQEAGFNRRWPILSYQAAVGNPPMQEHPRVANEMRAASTDHALANRRWTYAELAEGVLDAAGEPLHWREVARRADELGRRKSFSNSALANALFGHPDTFVREATGTYGLRRWGHKEAPYYPDLISSILISIGHPTSIGDIGHRVNQTRPIKPQSLQMFLDLHSRFYCSITGLYGLREWLSHEDRQTLRTPGEFVEARGSKGRLDPG